MKKFKKVKFVNEKGEQKELIYQPIIGKLEEGEYACDKFCPYSQSLCGKLRDPRKESDKNSSFMDFCGEIGLKEGDDPELVNYVPVDGTIEDNLNEMNSVFEILIKPNQYVRVHDVIDSVCQGSCPLYDSDHSKCKENNDYCILQELIKKSNYGTSK